MNTCFCGEDFFLSTLASSHMLLTTTHSHPPNTHIMLDNQVEQKRQCKKKADDVQMREKG